MDKFSSIDRIVGDISEEDKEEIHRQMREVFDEQIFEDLKDSEREKTKEEIEIIALVDEATNEIRRKYGLSNFNIPADNIHTIKKDKWPADLPGVAFYKAEMQGVAMLEESSRLVFMTKVFHELIHFKSYNALQITKKEDPELFKYRVGLDVVTRSGEKMYFTNLNEAVTEEITKKYSKKLFGNKLFADEVRQTESLKISNGSEKTLSGEPLFNNDTYYADVVSDEGIRSVMTESFTHQKEREILHVLIDKIIEKNPGQFKDSEEVFDIFAKAMMTGNILRLGKLIDGSFGRGTFRKIGELDENIELQQKLVRSL